MGETVISRRLLLASLLAVCFPGGVKAALKDTRNHAPALPAYRIRLPRDHGAHPSFRTEWWYFTGWFEAGGDGTSPIGIQITFFRTAPHSDPDNPARMAPHQLLLAHVAVASIQNGKLVHDQIARRTGLSDTGMSEVDSEGRFELRIGKWLLQRRADGVWVAQIRSAEMDLRCEFEPTQPEWLQGDAGFSRKGPRAEQASHYITLAHLASRAELRLRKDALTRRLTGKTWMDHEWSSSVLDERAVGWDWVGLHGDDGSSLMAFRIRGKDAASAAGGDIWQHAQLRLADGRVVSFAKIRFEVLQKWTSPRTGTEWPISLRLVLDHTVFELRPLMPDQELDSRMSTGTVYWEGAVQVFRRPAGPTGAAARDSGTSREGASAGDTVRWGKGYLELTGYWKPMKL